MTVSKVSHLGKLVQDIRLDIFGGEEAENNLAENRLDNMRKGIYLKCTFIR